MFLVQPPVGWGWEPAEQEPLGRPAGCLGLGTGGIAPLGRPSGAGRQAVGVLTEVRWGALGTWGSAAGCS